MEKRAGKFFDRKTMFRAWGELFASAYLLLMFGIYPFYMKEGYVDIGEAKYHFFMYCSLAALAILGVIGAVCCVQVLYKRIKNCEPYMIHWDNLSVVDLLVMLYATEIFISYVLSDYRSEALWGTEGWHIGLIPLLTLCGLYFLTARFWDGRAYIWYVSMAVSAVVFLLGILDRFSIYLIPLEIRQPAFISTLGNINWFCGYLTVLSPIGIYIFIFSEKDKESVCSLPHRKGWEKLLSGGYVIIIFMAGFCQGSNSIFLFFGALFYILLWMAVNKREWMAGWWLLLCLWGASAQIVRVIRQLLPEWYNYDTDNLCAYLTDSNITLAIGAAAFFLFIWLKKRDCTEKADCEERKKRVKNVHKAMICFLTGGIAVWVILTCLNTWKGIPVLSENDLFLFDEAWGNGRGAALIAAVKMYDELPPVNKLFGVGPDCFSACAYSLPEIAGALRENFGGDRLTNAHNELMTCLVNTGITGVILYLGIFISFIIRHFRKGTFISHMAIVCIFCYFIHNMVSFAQVLNLPYLFLILAMGERRKINEW